MLEDDDKLRVPDPNDAETPDESRGEIFVLAAAVSILAGLAFFLNQYERAHAPPSNNNHHASEIPADGEPSQLQRRAARLYDYTRAGGLEDYQWRRRDVLASLRHGPYLIAERACRAALRNRPDELLSEKIRRELLRVVDRRADHVPWNCLYRVYFSNRDRLRASLVRELENVWNRFRVFDGASRVAAIVAAEFARDGFLPDEPQFRRWARLCALNFEIPEGFACRKLMASVAPAQGGDLLDVVEVHLRGTKLNPTFDIPILLGGLQRLATRGQPPNWHIEETEKLPGYDTDLRLGAIFYLCRFVHSPTRRVARHASKALSEVAGYGVRAGDENLRRRWLEACGRAFGEKIDGKWTAPALAVSTGESDEPRYALRGPIERGGCRVRPGHPRWYCGSAQFNGTMPDELTDFFVKTRHIEWD